MVNAVIYNKIEALRRCISRIESKRPQFVHELIDNIDLQDIISINLERAVQVCVDLAAHLIAERDSDAPATMTECFEKLHELKIIDSELAKRLKKAVGFRNLVVHAYEKIDWNIVFSIITKDLSDFKEYSRCIMRLLDHPEES